MTLKFAHFYLKRNREQVSIHLKRTKGIVAYVSPTGDIMTAPGSMTEGLMDGEWMELLSIPPYGNMEFITAMNVDPVNVSRALDYQIAKLRGQELKVMYPFQEWNRTNYSMYTVDDKIWTADMDKAYPAYQSDLNCAFELLMTLPTPYTFMVGQIVANKKFSVEIYALPPFQEDLIEGSTQRYTSRHEMLAVAICQAWVIYATQTKSVRVSPS